MGLAASQCRYLMLISRKADTEFAGQQINQQRTMLANESSGLYAQLTEMEVPTAPSASQYTKTSYSFRNGDNGKTCAISSAKYNTTSGAYDITYTFPQTTAAKETAQAIYTAVTDNAGVSTYSRGTGTTLTKLTDAAAFIQANPTNDIAIALSSKLETIYGTNWATATYNKGNATPANTTAQKYYYTENNGVFQFVTQQQLDDITPGAANANKSGTLTYSYINETANVTQSDILKNCTVTWADSGRMDSFSYTDTLGNKVSYTLNCSTTTDETSYNDAYNEYQYKEQVYNNTQNSINAKLDIIQGEDKKLELQLENLDSTESAISTELDSVSGVIDKNIEKSFKAFA